MKNLYNLPPRPYFKAPLRHMRSNFCGPSYYYTRDLHHQSCDERPRHVLLYLVREGGQKVLACLPFGWIRTRLLRQRRSPPWNGKVERERWLRCMDCHHRPKMGIPKALDHRCRPWADRCLFGLASSNSELRAAGGATGAQRCVTEIVCLILESSPSPEAPAGIQPPREGGAWMAHAPPSCAVTACRHLTLNTAPGPAAPPSLVVPKYCLSYPPPGDTTERTRQA